MTNISDLRKEEVLCALYNEARINGYCVTDQETPRPAYELGIDALDQLSLPDARQLLQRHGGNFIGKDVRGRWLEVDLSGEDIDLSSYDEHFGCNAHKIIQELRESSKG